MLAKSSKFSMVKSRKYASRRDSVTLPARTPGGTPKDTLRSVATSLSLFWMPLTHPWVMPTSAGWRLVPLVRWYWVCQCWCLRGAGKTYRRGEHLVLRVFALRGRDPQRRWELLVAHGQTARHRELIQGVVDLAGPLGLRESDLDFLLLVLEYERDVVVPAALLVCRISLFGSPVPVREAPLVGGLEHVLEVFALEVCCGIVLHVLVDDLLGDVRTLAFSQAVRENLPRRAEDRGDATW